MDTKSDERFLFARVVFFGRGLNEYVDMFNLDLAALKGKRVLDCAAGPAAFARQAADMGIEVVACDPMYQSTAEQLRQAVDADAASVMAKQHAHPDTLHKNYTPTPERRKSMEVFLEDFASPQDGRYVAARLPKLPFADDSFDVVLIANLLFLYSDIASGGMYDGSPFDLDFHSRSIAELLRIAKNEVRIYPLQGASANGHKYLQPIIDECAAKGHRASVEGVKIRDLIGAENMLRVVK